MVNRGKSLGPGALLQGLQGLVASDAVIARLAGIAARHRQLQPATADQLSQHLPSPEKEPRIPPMRARRGHHGVDQGVPGRSPSVPRPGQPRAEIDAHHDAVGIEILHQRLRSGWSWRLRAAGRQTGQLALEIRQRRPAIGDEMADSEDRLMDQLVVVRGPGAGKARVMGEKESVVGGLSSGVTPGGRPGMAVLAGADRGQQRQHASPPDPRHQRSGPAVNRATGLSHRPRAWPSWISAASSCSGPPAISPGRCRRTGWR